MFFNIITIHIYVNAIQGKLVDYSNLKLAE